MILTDKYTAEVGNSPPAIPEGFLSVLIRVFNSTGSGQSTDIFGYHHQGFVFFVYLLYTFSSEEISTAVFILQFEKKGLGLFSLGWIAVVLIVWDFVFMVWVFTGCFCFVWWLGLVLGFFFHFVNREKNPELENLHLRAHS